VKHRFQQHRIDNSQKTADIRRGWKYGSGPLG
jgi:hypothetical protein